MSLIEAIEKGDIKDAKVVIVISDRPNAPVLEKVSGRGIETLCIDYKRLDYEKYEKILQDTLVEKKVDLVVLAGYLRILSPETVRMFYRRIINIHPSLLPRFGGLGMYGDRVHRAVLSERCEESGATVHFVDEGVDTGPILLQEKVSVSKDDTVETLSQRVLEVEHRLLVRAVKMLIEDGKI